MAQFFKPNSFKSNSFTVKDGWVRKLPERQASEGRKNGAPLRA